MSTAIPFTTPGGVFCVTSSGFGARRATRSLPVGASSSFAAADTPGSTVAQAVAKTSRRSDSARVMSSPEESAELRVRLVGDLLRGVVAAGKHLAMHVGRALLPRVDRLVAAVYVALLAPEHQHRHADLAARVGIGAVVHEVDRDRGAVVLAHRVDVLGIAAADVFGHRFRRERGK